MPDSVTSALCLQFTRANTFAKYGIQHFLRIIFFFLCQFCLLTLRKYKFLALEY